MATPAKPAVAPAPAKKPKPRKLSTAQLQARIARDAAELAKRAAKPKPKPAAKK